jgi:hypothetical protein
MTLHARLAGWWLILTASLVFTLLCQAKSVFAWSWVPSDEEIQKYRQSWNPFSHGPLLQQSVDIMPQGQWSIRPFIFSQIAEHSFGNRFSSTIDRKDGPVHLYSVQDPFVNFTNGITNHLEFVAGTSVNSFWAKDSERFNQGQGGPWTTNTGMGDTSLMVKYRPIVQDPDTWRPSITIQNEITLPTGRWFTGTKSPPGGFAPLGRFPATQFGGLGLTEGVTCRKIIQPFRISCGVYYTYTLPGSDAGQNTYTPDLINTRLVLEHILDDKRGFGYNIELVSLHGVPWRVDGHAINRGFPQGFSEIGIEPGIQWRFDDTNLVAAAGVLFTVAGQNALESIYPNFSVFWYFPAKGKEVQMR